MDAKDEHHIDFLYRALNDAQETIRSTDAKAEIVIVLVGGVLAFIGAIHGRIDTLPLQALTTVGLVHCRRVRDLGAVLIAAVCAIWALNPRVNPEEFIDVDGVKPLPLYYLPIKPAATGWRMFLPWRAGNYMELSVAEYLRHTRSGLTWTASAGCWCMNSSRSRSSGRKNGYRLPGPSVLSE